MGKRDMSTSRMARGNNSKDRPKFVCFSRGLWICIAIAIVFVVIAAIFFTSVHAAGLIQATESRTAPVGWMVTIGVLMMLIGGPIALSTRGTLSLMGVIIAFAGLIITVIGIVPSLLSHSTSLGPLFAIIVSAKANEFVRVEGEDRHGGGCRYYLLIREKHLCQVPDDRNLASREGLISYFNGNTDLIKRTLYRYFSSADAVEEDLDNIRKDLGLL